MAINALALTMECLEKITWFLKGTNAMRKHAAILLALLFTCGSLSIAGCDTKENVAKQQDKQQEKAGSTTTTEKEVNANWTIEVNDKHTVDQKGLPIDYTLQLTATKAGGTDPIGAYKGTARLIVKSDVSKLKGIPQSVMKLMGNIDAVADTKNLKFNVIDFAKAREANSKNSKSSSSGDDDALAPLVPDNKDDALAPLVPGGDKGKTDNSKTTNTLPAPSEEDKAVSNPDFYSAGTLQMSGTGKFDVKATGVQGESAHVSDQASGSDSVPFSMNIVGATVYIDIPKAGRFKGTVTGDPIK